jgi:hypothetical protein
MDRTFKIDKTGSEWRFKQFAVWELKSILGFRFWWRVYEDDSVEDCERYVRQALELPRYFP